MRLPTMFNQKPPVEAGGLLSFGASDGEVFRRAAGYVERILRGARPAELPIQPATRFELVINMQRPGRSGSRSRRRYWRGQIRSLE